MERLNIDVTVDDGKYRFTQDNAGHVLVYRHDEPWIDGSFPGINMVIAMACEIEELRKVAPRAPLVRNNDPDTSVKAAERAELKLSSRRVAVLDYALYCGDKGFTDDELKVRYATGAESTYRKRRSELTAFGYLEDTGMRRLNRAGNQEIVWRITDKGRKAR